MCNILFMSFSVVVLAHENAKNINNNNPDVKDIVNLLRARSDHQQVGLYVSFHFSLSKKGGGGVIYFIFSTYFVISTTIVSNLQGTLLIHPSHILHVIIDKSLL